MLLSGLLLVLPATGIAAGVPALRERIDAARVVPEGTRFAAFAWERPPEVVALYFGAGWCAPCHAFVPELRRVRDALVAGGADTEVVFVSLDGNEAEMRRYMRLQGMPWPAIDHRRLRMLPDVRALGGPAPPNLVLVDRNGTVLASGWAGRRYLGLAPVLDEWIGAVLPGPGGAGVAGPAAATGQGPGPATRFAYRDGRYRDIASPLVRPGRRHLHLGRHRCPAAVPARRVKREAGPKPALPPQR